MFDLCVNRTHDLIIEGFLADHHSRLGKPLGRLQIKIVENNGVMVDRQILHYIAEYATVQSITVYTL